jgi:hypothetical protein
MKNPPQNRGEKFGGGVAVVQTTILRVVVGINPELLGEFREQDDYGKAAARNRNSIIRSPHNRQHS